MECNRFRVAADCGDSRTMEAIDALMTEILGLGAFHSLEGRGQGWVREAHSLSNSERRE